MPIGTISASMVLLSAVGIPLVATSTITGAPDSFTLLGATFAVFCIVAYLRMKQPQTGVWALLFNAVSTVAVGWMLPEPVAQYVFHADLSNKAWAALAFFTGLGGGSLVTAFIVVSNKRLPAAVNSVADRITGHTGEKEDEEDKGPPPAHPNLY